MATGESLHSLQFQFRISTGEISKIIRITLQALKEKLVPLFLTSVSKEDLKKKAKEFQDRWDYPNCAGAADGKHVRIVCPDKSASLYYNYKNYFSMVMLAVVDANYKFMFVDVGSYGKEGDSGIFEKSKLGQQFRAGMLFPPPEKLPNSDLEVPYVFVGDDAFRLHTNMMKPYPQAAASSDYKKAIFNYRLCRARRVSENAFGLLAQVFRIFFTPIRLLPATIEDVIVVACCLHNMLRDGYLSPQGKANYEYDPLQEAPAANLINLGPGGGGFGNYDGYAVREIFTNYFVGNGSVAWQDRRVRMVQDDK